MLSLFTRATLARARISCHCVSVRPSICLSQVSVLLIWQNVTVHQQCHTIAQALYSFLMLKISAQTQTGSLPTELTNAGGVG